MATPSNKPAAALQKALGRRFKVNLPYRARKAQIFCRRCYAQWWISREDAIDRPAEWAFVRKHRCQQADLKRLRDRTA